MIRAFFLTIILICALACEVMGQISGTVTRTFQIKNAEVTECVGSPLKTFTVHYDPDTVGHAWASVEVMQVIDSTTVQIRSRGRFLSPWEETLTIRTDAELWLPTSGTSGDSLFSFVLDGTRRWLGKEKFKVETRPDTANPVEFAYLVNADTLKGAADTVQFPMVKARLPSQVWLVTATAGHADSCKFALGYRLREGIGWAGPPGELIEIVDTVEVKPGESAFVSFVLPFAGNIQPMICGVAGTGSDVVVKRIKAISKE